MALTADDCTADMFKSIVRADTFSKEDATLLLQGYSIGPARVAWALGFIQGTRGRPWAAKGASGSATSWPDARSGEGQWLNAGGTYHQLTRILIFSCPSFVPSLADSLPFGR